MLAPRYTCHPDQPACEPYTHQRLFDRRAAPTTSSAPLHATPQAVLEAITSFPHGSAGGPDGLRPQTPEVPAGWGAGECWIGERGWRDECGGGPRPIANPLLGGHHGPGQSPAVGGGAAVRPSVLVWRLPSRRAFCEERGWGQADSGRLHLASAGGEGGVSTACVCPRRSSYWRRGSSALGSRVARKQLSRRVDSMSRTCHRVMACL